MSPAFNSGMTANVPLMPDTAKIIKPNQPKLAASWAEAHGYGWVLAETGPRVLVQAISMLGVTEYPGPANNPTIMAWAKSLGLDKAYSADSIPWCGLGMAYIVSQAGFDPPVNPLWALNWQRFGNPVPGDMPMTGDIMVKTRKGGGHVTMYLAEDKTHYHCIGTNQSDMANVVRYPKEQFEFFRRCAWRANQPAQVRRIIVAPKGTLATKES